MFTLFTLSYPPSAYTGLQDMPRWVFNYMFSCAPDVLCEVASVVPNPKHGTISCLGSVKHLICERCPQAFRRADAPHAFTAALGVVACCANSRTAVATSSPLASTANNIYFLLLLLVTARIFIPLATVSRLQSAAVECAAAQAREHTQIAEPSPILRCPAGAHSANCMTLPGTEYSRDKWTGADPYESGRIRITSTVYLGFGRLASPCSCVRLL